MCPPSARPHCSGALWPDTNHVGPCRGGEEGGFAPFGGHSVHSLVLVLNDKKAALCHLRRIPAGRAGGCSWA